MKICNSCKKMLDEESFRKGRNCCKYCEKEKLKIWREKNKNHIKEYNIEYFQKNKNKIVEKRRKYLHDYRQTEKYKSHKKEYARINKEKTNEQIKERMKNDKIFKLKHQIRNLLNKCFRSKYNNTTKTEKILGCELDFFSKHLLNTFKNRYGYEWDGKDIVHIDHIIPLAIATTEEETIKLCHYTNLQLLRAKDNLKKSNKLEYSNETI